MDPSDERLDEEFGRATAAVRRAVDQLEVRVPASAELRVRLRRRTRRNATVIGVVVVLVLGLGMAFGPGGSASRLAVEPPGTAAVPEPFATTSTTERPLPEVLTRPTVVPDGTHDGLLSLTMRLSASPATGLLDRVTVAVDGVGFPGGQSITLVMCTSAAAAESSIAAAQSHCDIVDQGSARAGDDGTFHADFEVKRLLATLAGPYDCAQGTLDPAHFVERRDRGETGLFAEPGAQGCAIVAVTLRNDPNPDGGGTLTPTDAGAFPVLFDPTGLPAVRRDPATVVLNGCTDVRYSDGTPYADGFGYGREPNELDALNLVMNLAGILSEAPLSAPPCDARVHVTAQPDGTYVVPVPGMSSYPELMPPGMVVPGMPMTGTTVPG